MNEPKKGQNGGLNEYDFDVAGSLSDVLAESRTMTGFVGILFGFLLSASLSVPNIEGERLFLLLLSLVASAASMLLFALPVLYHHLQFPYREKEKFILRSHKFMILGFIPFGIAVFLSLTLATYSVFGWGALGIATLVFLLLTLVYHFRK